MRCHRSYLLLQRTIIKERRAYLLGNPTGLAVLDVRLADLVQQLGLAGIDVTHDTADRRPQTTLGAVVVAPLLPCEALLPAFELLQLRLALGSVSFLCGLGLELGSSFFLFSRLSFSFFKLPTRFLELLGFRLCDTE